MNSCFIIYSLSKSAQIIAIQEPTEEKALKRFCVYKESQKLKTEIREIVVNIN